MSALANGWKRIFKNHGDPHFIHTMPAKSLAPKITQPEAIEGAATSFEITAWPEIDRRGVFTAEAVTPSLDGLVEAILKAAY